MAKLSQLEKAIAGVYQQIADEHAVFAAQQREHEARVSSLEVAIEAMREHAGKPRARAKKPRAVGAAVPEAVAV